MTGGRSAGRTKDMVVGAVALAYAVWLVYAGGLDYLFIAALFYLAGTVLFALGAQPGQA